MMVNVVMLHLQGEYSDYYHQHDCRDDDDDGYD